MCTIQLADGTALNCQGVHGDSLTYMGVSRDALTFSFDPKEVELNQALAAFSPENCAAITIDEGEDGVFVHEHYTIRVGAGIGCKDMAQRGMSGGPIQDGGEAVWVTMAQATPTERMLEALMKHGG